MVPNAKNLKRLLHHGAVSEIAQKLGISTPAVSQALKSGRPSSKAVQMAMRMVEESGALGTAQKMATIPTAA